MCTFSSTASLSANQRPLRGARRLDVDLEHHALGDLVVAGEEAVEGGVEVVGLDLGEVAELADVDAEHRHPGFVGEVDGAEHGAVAAERDHEVEALGEASRSRVASRRVGRGTRTSTPCSARRSARVRGQLGRGRRGPGAGRARRVRRSRRAHVPRSATAASSAGVVERRAARVAVHEELDVAVGAAERRRHHVDDDAGRAPTSPSRTSCEHRAVHRRDRGRRRPCRPGRARPRTAASPAARGRRRAVVQRASGGRHGDAAR